jgi:glycosyltransferase involved in cell wall biosynthesis
VISHSDTEPLVSLLLTSYNHERFVRQALDSVLAQNYSNLDVIITDDYSTDASAAVIEAWLAETGYPATFIANKTNRGICAVRNTALAHARGKYICTLAADDWYEDDHVSLHVSAFENMTNDVAFIFSQVNVVDSDGVLIPQSDKNSVETIMQNLTTPLFERLLSGNFITAPATTIRRSALDAVGGYDESLYFEDWDMWLRLSHQFEAVFVPGAVSNYRVLQTSMSHSAASRPRMCEATVELLLKWLTVRDISEFAVSSCTHSVRYYSTLLAKFGNRTAARKGFREAQRQAPSVRWFFLAWVMTAPGFAAVWAWAKKVKEMLS